MVNNAMVAGLALEGPAEDRAEQDWDVIFDVGLRGDAPRLQARRERRC